MVDMASISAAITGLKTATDIAKGIMDIKTTSEVQRKVIELQGVILSAQSSALAAQSDQFTLLERVRDLEAQMAKLEAWNAEKDKYELKRIYTGAFARVRKTDAKPAEPPHWICANCYEHGRKSILQDFGRDPRDRQFILWQCPNCKALTRVHYNYKPGHEWIAAQNA